MTEECPVCSDKPDIRDSIFSDINGCSWPVSTAHIAMILPWQRPQNSIGNQD
jgi:hypothetical protein